MSFLVKAYLDDHALSVTTATAKEAFAKAVEWQLTKSFKDVRISDGTKTYSIPAFSRWRSWRSRKLSMMPKRKLPNDSGA
jgi:hypothetical protein